jgi:hypothetical protein
MHRAGLQRGGGVVAPVACAAGSRRRHRNARRPPVEVADDLARPGVEQQLVRVEAVAAVGPPGAVGAQAVDLAGRPGVRRTSRGPGCGTGTAESRARRPAVRPGSCHAAGSWSAAWRRTGTARCACGGAVRRHREVDPWPSQCAPSGQGRPACSTPCGVRSRASAGASGGPFEEHGGQRRQVDDDRLRPAVARPTGSAARRPAACRHCCRRSACESVFSRSGPGAGARHAQPQAVVHHGVKLHTTSIGAAAVGAAAHEGSARCGLASSWSIHSKPSA